MLMHGFYDKFPGAHGWSTHPNGISDWEFSTTPAYTFNVNLAGMPTTLDQRERPQVVLQNGSLTHLFNGARKGSAPTFSMVTEVCQHGPPTRAAGTAALTCPSPHA